MTWATLTHAEMAARLRELLAADPLPPPRILYDRPDGRHQLPRPAVGGDTPNTSAVSLPLGTGGAGGGAK